MTRTISGTPAGGTPAADRLRRLVSTCPGCGLRFDPAAARRNPDAATNELHTDIEGAAGCDPDAKASKDERDAAAMQDGVEEEDGRKSLDESMGENAAALCEMRGTFEPDPVPAGVMESIKAMGAEQDRRNAERGVYRVNDAVEVRTDQGHWRPAVVVALKPYRGRPGYDVSYRDSAQAWPSRAGWTPENYMRTKCAVCSNRPAPYRQCGAGGNDGTPFLCDKHEHEKLVGLNKPGAIVAAEDVVDPHAAPPAGDAAARAAAVGHAMLERAMSRPRPDGPDAERFDETTGPFPADDVAQSPERDRAQPHDPAAETPRKNGTAPERRGGDQNAAGTIAAPARGKDAPDRFITCAVKVNGTENGRTEILDTHIDGGEGEPLIVASFFDKATAEFFCRAANALPSLLAACRDADSIEIFRDDISTNMARLNDRTGTVESCRIARENVAASRATIRAIRDRLRAAIAKAGGAA